MNYSQEYISHGYIELEIPAINSEYALQPDHLHIWPRDKFMLIALPNTDKSFTATLFMPFEMFESIKANKDVVNFFEKEFADIVPLIGREKLARSFMKATPGGLISIKVLPLLPDSALTTLV